MICGDGRGKGALWRALSAVIGVVALAATSGRARAEPPRPAALGWLRAPGAESCIGVRALAEAVEARLGHAVLVPASRAEVSIEGNVAPAGGEPGWQVSITVADGDGKVLGTRELARAGTDCRVIDVEVALTIALLIDPGSALPLAAASSSAKAPPPAAKAAVAPAVSAPPEPATVPVPATWDAAFLAGPVVSLGALPTVGVGVQIRGLITPPRFTSFQIGGSVWAPASTSSGARGGSFVMALGALSVCPLTGLRLGFRYAACAGVEAGSIRAGGFGFPLTLEQDRPLVNGVLEGRVVRRLAGPFALSAGFALAVPFLRNRFYYIDPAGREREVFLSSPVVGYLDVLGGFEL